MRLTMVRPDLEGIPVFALPNRFRIRWYQPGDERSWFDIHQRADRENVITKGLFRRKFGRDEHLLADRQCYLVSPEGAVIGTASAWFDDDFPGRRHGRIHYVAIVPEYQGRGLSKPLLTAACIRLAALRHDCAYLTTSSSRVPAIHLYRQFGFVPVNSSEKEAKALQEINSPGTASAGNMGQCRRGHS